MEYAVHLYTTVRVKVTGIAMPVLELTVSPKQ